MTESPRTPGGEPNQCPLCDTRTKVEPSEPFGDAPCPSCNTSELETENVPRIDLAAFSIGCFTVGESMTNLNASALSAASELKHSGVEVGLDIGVGRLVLDCLFVTLDKYQGDFVRSGTVVSVSADSSPAEIEQLFGEPYWKDLSDGKLIMFYEYQSGRFEVQFEFPDTKGLGYITIARNGVMSHAEQRVLYGVDKPWPPVG